MKVIALGGEPATGKTTLMWKVLEKLNYQFGAPKDFVFGKLRGHWWEVGNVWLLGRYEKGQAFAGTDRLSMAVQPDAERFMLNRSVSLLAPKTTVVFEGDRLFTRTFLTYCARLERTEVFPFILSTPAFELEQRHVDRKDTQSETFKKGRRTKYAQLADLPRLSVLPSVLLTDIEGNLNRLWESLSFSQQ